MRRLIAASLAATALTFAVCSVPALAADADPTVHQIYEAAASGHLDQAQQMMDQVLRDHPDSSKAHFVQAELYAREGKTALARAELNKAEELKPGLPDERPQAVEALKAQLGIGQRAVGERPYGVHSAPAAAHFPWGTVLILVLVVGVLWMLFRRRNTYAQYPNPTSGMPGGAAGTYGPGAGGYVGPGGGAMGGGVGSSIAGGLAGGLAAGAGIVAGEELAHHFLDGGQRQGAVLPPANEDAERNSASNSDMGGADFGVNDPGSWDDGSSGGDGGGGGGGDDWT
ncbi:MAG: tetratricopeptide repeat protein [Steroidobacteraceae bacterium]